jgi:hypothetical protein
MRDVTKAVAVSPESIPEATSDICKKTEKSSRGMPQKKRMASNCDSFATGVQKDMRKMAASNTREMDKENERAAE